MVLDKFFFNILIRVILIVLTCLVLGIIIPHLEQGYYYTLTGIVALIVIQSMLLVTKVNKTNTDLEKFFASVKDCDSSVRFSEIIGNESFKKLYHRMNQLSAEIQRVKIENERSGLFLQSLIDQADIGLLTLTEKGECGILNKTTQLYLNLQSPRQFSSLHTKNPELLSILHNLQPGHEVLYKTVLDNHSRSLLIKASGIKFNDHYMKLVSLHDITPELDRKELDSWQKLIRVLTHEIMNSVSPIISLTRVISTYFKPQDKNTIFSPEKINQQIIDKTLQGLNTIEETGEGLLEFVNKYRSLTSLPKPDLNNIKIEGLFRNCIALMETNISHNIKISSIIESDDISVNADYAQIEQVLINLIQNAAAALLGTKKGVIQLKGYQNEEAVFIQVKDNGSGIPDEIIDNIFIPFFTTKKNGSGIGLSLSKQIMQNHNGTISVNSFPDKGSEFILQFSKSNLQVTDLC
ncbi:MAG: Multi-sensor signal transduction histidine kinase [Bacteroidetes bacterium]|nr:Multi-sensor signal transduction histidine kinase [Bacteroidota bacterium]